VSTTGKVIFSLVEHAIGYKNQSVLAAVNLTIKAGETVAIVGASGSGKSSLLKTLYAQQRELAALCPQQSMLVTSLSVYHNIYIGQLQRHNIFYNLFNLIRPFQQHLHDIGQLSALLGLKAQLFKSVDRLSGGQQQRTAVGRALYQKKSIFLGDEPLSSIDPIQGAALLQLIKQRHQTVVIVLHDKEMALNQFDRVIALADGQVVIDCAANLLTAQQMDAIYQQDFSAAVADLACDNI